MQMDRVYLVASQAGICKWSNLSGWKLSCEEPLVLSEMLLLLFVNSFSSSQYQQPNVLNYAVLTLYSSKAKYEVANG
jgi:hypothetical protein